MDTGDKEINNFVSQIIFYIVKFGVIIVLILENYFPKVTFRMTLSRNKISGKRNCNVLFPATDIKKIV